LRAKPAHIPGHLPGALHLNDFVNSSAKPHRLLLAWLSPQEFVTLLQNGKIPSPDDMARQQSTIASSLAALASRPVYVPENPVIETESDPLLTSLHQRPDIQAVLENLQWEPAMVNLRKVLSYQPLVNLDGLEGRVVGLIQTLVTPGAR
jgi:hypothetical protein